MTPSDAGVRTFSNSIQLTRIGTTSITVQDQVTGATGSVNVTISSQPTTVTYVSGGTGTGPGGGGLSTPVDPATVSTVT